jgi:hypothetical protein
MVSLLGARYSNGPRIVTMVHRVVAPRIVESTDFSPASRRPGIGNLCNGVAGPAAALAALTARPPPPHRHLARVDFILRPAFP